MKIKCAALSLLLVTSMISGCNSKEIASNELSSIAPQASASPIVPSDVPPTPKKDEIPEPFKLAVSKFISHDYDLTLKYIDLTSTDFSDSKYAYKASIIKCIIMLARSVSVLSLSDIFISGSTKGKSLYSSADATLVKKELQNIREMLLKYQDEMPVYASDMMNEIDPTIETVDYPDLTTTNPASSKDLSFFKDVGYPVPSESDVDEYLKTSTEALADYYASAIFSTNKINYPLFLHHLVSFVDEKELRKKMLQKIIDLTENDKYSEHRIYAQDEMKKL